MPGWLCFGSANRLLNALADCATRRYGFWRSVADRMHSLGAYLLDPRLVDIQFAPLVDVPTDGI